MDMLFRVKLLLWGLLLAPLFAFAQNDVPTQFTNQGGIINTRHNMMQSTEQTNSGGTMNAFRNRYGGVCVYCHTPHGSNATVGAPLWNRLLPAGSSFTLYSALGTPLNETVYNPGAGSLPCLSCHDGTQAVDAIINMPGSGGYSAGADPTSWSPAFIVNTPDGYAKSGQHRTLSTSGVNSCLACHAPDGGAGGLGLGVATDFTVFAIGKDLRNDHPIGVTFPTTTGGGTDWNTPGGTKSVLGLTNKFFDENSNGRMDKAEIRLYDTGNGASVECASCHDPHGVSATPGGVINATFLRKTNSGSAVCLTCHSK